MNDIYKGTTFAHTFIMMNDIYKGTTFAQTFNHEKNFFPNKRDTEVVAGTHGSPEWELVAAPLPLTWIEYLIILAIVRSAASVFINHLSQGGVS